MEKTDHNSEEPPRGRQQYHRCPCPTHGLCPCILVLAGERDTDPPFPSTTHSYRCISRRGRASTQTSSPSIPECTLAIGWSWTAMSVGLEAWGDIQQYALWGRQSIWAPHHGAGRWIPGNAKWHHCYSFAHRLRPGSVKVAQVWRDVSRCVCDWGRCPHSPLWRNPFFYMTMGFPEPANRVIP